MASHCPSDAVPGRFHRRCAVRWASGMAVAASRAAQTTDLSMGITSNTGLMAVKPAWVTWYCCAGTIITWFTKEASTAGSLLMVKSTSRTNGKSLCRTGPHYPGSQVLTTSSSGWTGSSSKPQQTARVAPRNGMPANRWTGTWQCRLCFRIRRDTDTVSESVLAKSVHRPSLQVMALKYTCLQTMYRNREKLDMKAIHA